MILLMGSVLFLVAPDENAIVFKDIANEFFVDFRDTPKTTIIVEITDNYLGYKNGWSGMCEYYRAGPSNKIFLERSIFKKNIWFIHQVIYHELGHCVLDLRHTDKRNNLMAPRKFDTNSVTWGNELSNMKSMARRKKNEN